MTTCLVLTQWNKLFNLKVESELIEEFSENISWINGSTDVEKADHIISNGLTNMMVSQCIAAFKRSSGE